MKKLIAVLVAGLFAAGAFAQAPETAPQPQQTHKSATHAKKAHAKKHAKHAKKAHSKAAAPQGAM